MTDTHIHIGRFEDIYYEAGQVFDTVFAGGEVTHIVYSSTTSCKDGVQYGEVAKEIEGAVKLVDCRIATPLFWFIPAYIYQGINIETEMKKLPYGGFKLHPYAHTWTFNTPDDDKSVKQHKALHTIFKYAALNDVPVLIHTGESDSDAPARFKAFFAEYPGARCILAHGRPVSDTINMMTRYPNVYCDTAFMDKEDVLRLINAGFACRVITGSDFPITHRFANRYSEGTSEITLAEQYRRDVARMKTYQTLLEGKKQNAL